MIQVKRQPIGRDMNWAFYDDCNGCVYVDVLEESGAIDCTPNDCYGVSTGAGDVILIWALVDNPDKLGAGTRESATDITGRTIS